MSSRPDADPNGGLMEALERRLAKVETRLRELEAAVHRSEVVTDPGTARAGGGPKPTSQAVKREISGEFIRKVLKEDQYGGQELEVTTSLTNNIGKDVKSFTGELHFSDLFRKSILKVRITCEEPIRVGQSLTWTCGFGINKFMENHRRLVTIKPENMAFEFKWCEAIFPDGTRLVNK